MPRPITLLSIAPILLLSQIPGISKNSQPEVNQRLTMYSKPAVVRILSGCSGKYEYQGRTYPFLSGGLGSGYFVDQNGYIVTNAHVVNFSDGGEKACRERLFNNLVERISGQRDLTQVSQQSKDLIRQNSELTDFIFKNEVILPNADKFKFEVKEPGLPVSQPDQGDIGKDVAIIKIEVTNAPVLELGDSSTVQIQSPIVVLGYPGVADNTSVLSEDSFLEASVLDGKVANPNKKLQNGSPVLQLNVTVAPGSSGGPVLNDEGKVIGMITFGGSGYDEETSFPYAIPTSTILEFTRKSGAAIEEGSTGPLYREGLDLYWNQDYEGAKTKFEAVKSLFKQHSEVDKLIKVSEQKIAERWQSKSYVPLLVGVGIALVGLLGAYFVVRRRSVPAFADGASSEHDFVERATAAIERQPSRPSQAEGLSNRTVMSAAPRGKDTVLSLTIAVLELKNSEGQSQKFALNNTQHRLGRDRNWADLNLPESGWEVLSKRHAILKREGDSYRIYDGDGDKASTNGVKVNGTQISLGGQLLGSGDRLQIGEDYNRVTGIFQIEDSKRTAPEPGNNSSYRDGQS
jgi:S1-C subfamily serine protease/pSer/pThr/pTyr-binding forkhead associated (FHA) protein